MSPWSALKAASERAAASNRRPFHDDEARAFQMLHKALGDDLGNDLVSVVDALAALVSEREGERRGKVGRVGGRELVGVGHRRTIVEERERSKNMRTAIVFVAMLLLALPVRADSPDISARRLLSNWKSQDPMMSRVAEVIAAAYSGGLSWRGSLAGKEIYCPPPGLKGHEIMISFEQFIVLDQPDLFGVGKMHVGQFLEHLCVIGGGVAVGDLDAAPALERRENHEYIGHAVSLVFVIVPDDSSGSRRNRSARLDDQLLGGFIQTDEGAIGIARLLVSFQHIFHGGDEAGVGVRRNHPLPIAVGLEDVFFRVLPIVLSLAFSTVSLRRIACGSRWSKFSPIRPGLCAPGPQFSRPRAGTPRQPLRKIRSRQ